MIKMDEIANFDAFGEFGQLLVGQIFDYPLNLQTVSKVQQKKKFKVVTVKSSSTVTAEIMKEFPNVSLFITRTVGTNHIDVEGIEKLGVTVKNIPDYGAFSIAEHVFALLLTMTRKVIFLDKDIRNGVFSSKGAQGYTLEGKTMGVVGTGRIGKEIIKLAQAFNMYVVAYDLYPHQQSAIELNFKYISLKELLENSDVVSLNIPLTDQTRHIIGAKQLQQMKRGSILINTSRGAIIDTNALVKKVEKFKYVGLDVLEDEDKFSNKHPLLNFENVVITPHCAFFTDESTKKISIKTKELIENQFGEIEVPVD